ncbi:hypothetical protein SNEBB_005579 [Seison nebaliae]|nr:hypothetical protein SNEBB_005579 [Seison nebaliae]
MPNVNTKPNDKFPALMQLDGIRNIDRCREVPQEGAGFLFGERAMDKFLEAHQLVMEGYARNFDSDKLATSWSAPNYCYRCGNLASVMNWTSDLQNNFLLYGEYPTSLREHILQKHIKPRTGLPLQTHRKWPDNIYPPKYQTLSKPQKLPRRSSQS